MEEKRKERKRERKPKCATTIESLDSSVRTES